MFNWLSDIPPAPGESHFSNFSLNIEPIPSLCLYLRLFSDFFLFLTNNSLKLFFQPCDLLLLYLYFCLTFKSLFTSSFLCIYFLQRICILFENLFLGVFFYLVIFLRTVICVLLGSTFSLIVFMLRFFWCSFFLCASRFLRPTNTGYFFYLLSYIKVLQKSLDVFRFLYISTYYSSTLVKCSVVIFLSRLFLYNMWVFSLSELLNLYLCCYQFHICSDFHLVNLGYFFWLNFFSVHKRKWSLPHNVLFEPLLVLSYVLFILIILIY